MATNGINEDEERVASKFILDSMLQIPIERRTAAYLLPSCVTGPMACSVLRTR